MFTHAEKQHRPQQQSSPDLKTSNTSASAASHQPQPTPNLSWTYGNQAVLQLQRSRASGHAASSDTEPDAKSEFGPETPTTRRFVPDSSPVPAPAPAPITIQPKLTVNSPGDIYEQEADHISDQVMHMPEPQLQRACACGGTCAECQTEQTSQEHQRLQTKHVGPNDAGQTAAPPIVHEALASPGQPLSTATRAFFEPRFGYDLSQVRIHTSGKAAQSATAIDAMAYTVGREITFGTGKYAPETTEGKRLLAHELAHVQQQRGSTLEGSPAAVQRQPASSTPAPDPSADASDPGYEEAAHAPSYHVRIIAHASPRWRGARGAADADRRNLELSQRRADAVSFEVKKLLASKLGAGASVSVDVTVTQQEGTVGVEEEARGSRDTLPEAKGDRSDNALKRRRVDVIIDSSQRISGSALATGPLLTRPTASRFWHVSVDMAAGASFVAAGSLLAITLTNDLSGQSMTGYVFAGGIGPKASLGASISIWSDPTGFYTDEPLNFIDFDHKWVQYASFGVSLFIGYGGAYLSFLGRGEGARQIDVGGWTTGTFGIGGSTVYGPLQLQGPYPPTELPIKGTDVTDIPYERTERGEDLHKVLFSTDSAKLDGLEADILDSFLTSVTASNR